MIITTTGNTIINTSLAEVEVTIITSAAVIVCIGGRNLAVVAVDREDADSLWSWGGGYNRYTGACWAVIGQCRQTSKLSKPLVTGGSSAGDRDITVRAGVHSGGLLVVEHIGDISVQLAAAGRTAGWLSEWCEGGGRALAAVDQELLESSLDLGNASWVDGLLGIANGRLCNWSRSCLWGWLNWGRLLINRADWGRFLVLNCSRLGCDGLLLLDGDLETEL